MAGRERGGGGWWEGEARRQKPAFRPRLEGGSGSVGGISGRCGFRGGGGGDGGGADVGRTLPVGGLLYRRALTMAGAAEKSNGEEKTY